jgi:hypothetical protein
MNSYFFKMNQAERNNILDQHRTIYDGFATQYGQPKEQPLYVQDYANDKNGITVSNKGDVKSYTNMKINEAYADAGFVPDETFEDKEFMVSMGEQKDMIGDGEDDFDHGTFEDDETEILLGPEGEFDLFVDNDEEDFDDIDITSMFGEEIEEEKVEPLQEQLNKTLDMFKRFKNY